MRTVLCSLIIVLFVVPTAWACMPVDAERAAEVAFDNNEMFDLTKLTTLGAEDVNYRIEDQEKDENFPSDQPVGVYRSHSDDRVMVKVGFSPAGYDWRSVLIVLPGEMDPEAFDFVSAMQEEIAWLIQRGVIAGFDPKQIPEITWKYGPGVRFFTQGMVLSYQNCFAPDICVRCTGAGAYTQLPPETLGIKTAEVTELLNKQWKLQSFGKIGQEKSLLPDTEITLRFGEGHEVEGGGGCNSYFGTYEATEDGAVSIRDLTWTEMACASPVGLMEQEMRVLNALGDVSAFEIRPDYLRLFYEDGQSVLTFVANPVERGIADVWMHEVDEEGVDYQVLELKADNAYALGQHVGPYQIEPLEEGAYVWKEEEKVLEMTVTSSTQDPERVGNTYSYTEVEVTEETLSWMDEDGKRMAFTRGILVDSPTPPTAVKSRTWGQIKRLLK